MVLNIISDDLVSYMLTHCSEKISLFPKMATPKFLLNSWKFFKNFTCGNTLQDSYYLCNRIPWWKRNQYMNMVFGYLTSINFKIKVNRDLIKNLLHPVPNVTNKDLLSVFRAPYQMVLSFINCMTCSSQNHAEILMGKQPLLKPPRHIPMRQ